MYKQRHRPLQISCTVAAHLNCAFIFACAKSRFSHDEAKFIEGVLCNSICLALKLRCRCMYRNDPKFTDR